MAHDTYEGKGASDVKRGTISLSSFEIMNMSSSAVIFKFKFPQTLYLNLNTSGSTNKNIQQRKGRGKKS